MVLNKKNDLVLMRLIFVISFLLFICGSQDALAQTEEGIASYYHGRFHGRKTASGVPHDNSALVAAHRTYPIGTYLLVTNLSNKKNVVVCVTDRGPRKKSRIIDLSKEAAKQLDFVRKGITRVSVEVIPDSICFNSLDSFLLEKSKIEQIHPNAIDSVRIDEQ